MLKWANVIYKIKMDTLEFVKWTFRYSRDLFCWILILLPNLSSCKSSWILSIILSFTCIAKIPVTDSQLFLFLYIYLYLLLHFNLSDRFFMLYSLLLSHISTGFWLSFSFCFPELFFPFIRFTFPFYSIFVVFSIAFACTARQLRLL